MVDKKSTTFMEYLAPAIARFIKFFVLFAEKDRASILKNGIKLQKAVWRETNGVFVSPVTDNYYNTHQWHREVQRVRNVPKLAARIRIPDDQQVFIGKYNEEHVKVAASDAVGIAIEHEDPMGLEVIVPRAIKPDEIIKVYKLPKMVGWRYHPGAKGSKPCGCPYCQKGEPFSKKIKEDYERSL